MLRVTVDIELWGTEPPRPIEQFYIVNLGGGGSPTAYGAFVVDPRKLDAARRVPDAIFAHVREDGAARCVEHALEALRSAGVSARVDA